MSVYEGTKGMLQKFQNNIFERVNQLLKDRDGKIEKNASDILSNAKQAKERNRGANQTTIRSSDSCY